MKAILLFVFFTIAYLSTFSQCNLTITSTDATCATNCDGSATANPTGGMPPYTYYWSNNANTQTADYLCPGTYYCMISDAIGCSSSPIFVTISSPPQITFLQDTINNVTCFGACNGSATEVVIGGIPPYTFDWGNGDTTAHADSLCSNYYYVYVYDSIGCSSYTTVNITEPPQIVNTPSIIPPSCTIFNGQILLSTTGGVIGAGYNYIWNNGATTVNLYGLNSGIYTVTVSDAVNCSVTDTYILNTSDGPQPVIFYSDITCFGANNGKVDSVAGIYPPPLSFYSWANGSTIILQGALQPQDTSIPYPNNLATGNYWLTVSTPIGCNGYANFSIAEPLPISDNPSISNNYCYGDSSGSIYIFPGGGTGSPTITWGPPLAGNNGNTAWNLHAGTYTVTISDGNGCTLAESFNVTEPPLFTSNVTPFDISCFGNVDGYVVANLIGGTPPYFITLDSMSQVWSSYDTLFSLTAGNYILYIKDNNYCTLPHVPFTIIEPSLLSSTYSYTDPTCTDNDGNIQLSVIGGTPPYNLSWNTGATDTLLMNLPQGFYDVNITDIHGCTDYQSLYLTPSSNPAKLWGEVYYSGGLVSPNDANILLFGNTIGMTAIDTINSTTNSASIWEFLNLMPGTYYLKTNIVNHSLYPNVMDTYYDSTFIWSLATPINLNCNDTVYVNFKMYETTFSNTGSGSINGNVHMYTTGKAVGEPVPGAEILVEQEPNDVPVQSVYTDTLGHYQINGLNIGTGYHLLVDIPGLPLISTYQNLSFTNTDSIYNNLNFIVDTITGTGIYADSLTFIHSINNQISINVYPNPFTSKININITAKNSDKINFKLINNLGQTIQNLDKDLFIGKNEIELNTQPIKNGTYYLLINIDNNVYVKKLISNNFK